MVAMESTLTQYVGRTLALKSKERNDIVNGPDDAFRFTILRRGAWKRHAQLDTMGEEEKSGR